MKGLHGETRLDRDRSDLELIQSGLRQEHPPHEDASNCLSQAPQPETACDALQCNRSSRQILVGPSFPVGITASPKKRRFSGASGDVHPAPKGETPSRGSRNESSKLHSITFGLVSRGISSALRRSSSHRTENEDFEAAKVSVDSLSWKWHALRNQLPGSPVDPSLSKRVRRSSQISKSSAQATICTCLWIAADKGHGARESEREGRITGERRFPKEQSRPESLSAHIRPSCAKPRSLGQPFDLLEVGTSLLQSSLHSRTQEARCINNRGVHGREALSRARKPGVI